MSAIPTLRALQARKSSFVVLLGVDGAIFAAILVFYFVARVRTPVWPRPFHFPSGLMTVSMGMFAGASSFVLHVARRSEAGKDIAMARRMAALAIVGWATFLFLLAMEWGRLYFFEGVTLLSNPWRVRSLGITYYALTGWIAAHMLAGSAWLLSMFGAPPKPFNLAAVTLLVDFTNALFGITALLVILSATDLGGF